MNSTILISLLLFTLFVIVATVWRALVKNVTAEEVDKGIKKLSSVLFVGMVLGLIAVVILFS